VLWLSAPTSKTEPARTCWFAFLSLTSATLWCFARVAFSPCRAQPAITWRGPWPPGQPSQAAGTALPFRQLRTSHGHASHGQTPHGGAGRRGLATSTARPPRPTSAPPNTAAFASRGHVTFLRADPPPQLVRRPQVRT